MRRARKPSARRPPLRSRRLALLPNRGASSFAKALDNALQTVSRTQQEASSLQRQFQMGVESVSIEDTMVAMQKAQIGFQSALAVRNRLVSAYTDIMNMQV